LAEARHITERKTKERKGSCYGCANYGAWCDGLTAAELADGPDDEKAGARPDCFENEY
jgi:hypothetical protein